MGWYKRRVHGIFYQKIKKIKMKLFLAAACIAAVSAVPGTCGDYGCSKNMDTDGCSSQTGSQDGCGSGISCSQKMAKTDESRTREHRAKIRGAGSNKSIDHCILAAICSRESRSGNVLQTWNGEFGWGDCHGGTCYGFGLMQIDRRYLNPQGSWDSQRHIEQATDILIDTINCVARNHPSWELEQKTKGGISGYNAGCGNVQTYDGMDIGTTGNDYSSDVVSRANYFRDAGV